MTNVSAGSTAEDCRRASPGRPGPSRQMTMIDHLRRRGWFAALAVGLLILAGCGGGDDSDSQTGADASDTPATEADPAADGDAVIHFGASLSLTGALANEGRLVRDGYEFIFDELNERGGIEVGGKKYALELTYYDDESSPDTAARLVERLIVQDEVDFLLGPYSSGTTMTASAVAEQNGVPMVVAHAASTPIYERGFKNLFGVIPPIHKFMSNPLRMLGEIENGPKTVAILYENVLPWQLASESGAAEAQSLGMEVVYRESYPSGTTDLSSALAAIRDLDPDVLIGAGYTGDMILITRQAAELGLDTDLTVYMLGPTLPGVRDDLGDLAEGLVEPVEWRATLPFVDDYLGWSAQDYADRFEEAYDYFPDHHPPQSSAAVMAYVHALEEAGSLDRDAVREALATTDIMTFYGPVKFNEIGQNDAKELSVVQIQNGEPVVIYPADLAEGELVYPAG